MPYIQNLILNYGLKKNINVSILELTYLNEQLEKLNDPKVSLVLLKLDYPENTIFSFNKHCNIILDSSDLDIIIDFIITFASVLRKTEIIRAFEKIFTLSQRRKITYVELSEEFKNIYGQAYNQFISNKSAIESINKTEQKLKYTKDN